MLAQRTLRDLERELLEERRMRNHCEAEASRWRAEAERLALLLAAKRPHTLCNSSTPSTLSVSSSSPDTALDAPTAAAPEPDTVHQVSQASEGKASADEDGNEEEEEEDQEHDIMAGVRKSVAEARVVAGDSQRTEGTNDGDSGCVEEEDVEALASSFRCLSVVELAVCARDQSHS